MIALAIHNDHVNLKAFYALIDKQAAFTYLYAILAYFWLFKPYSALETYDAMQAFIAVYDAPAHSRTRAYKLYALIEDDYRFYLADSQTLDPASIRY